jgi:nucleotide-binding universal stress UspA family protein
MKNLLAVVGNSPGDPVLETALLIARRFNSHITGLHSLRSEFEDDSRSDTVLRIYSDFNRTWEGLSSRDQARSRFRVFMNRHNVPSVGSREKDDVSASWFEGNARKPALVGIIGRIHDLIVIEQPGNLSSIDGINFEDAVFESGRPVLTVPKLNRAVLGEVIGIAWNGTAETTHTVALAMPLLKRAKKVVVVAVGSKDMPEPGPGGEELAEALERHGMNVSLRMAFGRQKRQGQSFLKEAIAAEVDLLLKGAYARSRLRQTIFGGATRHIILKSPIPVLMAR